MTLASDLIESKQRALRFGIEGKADTLYDLNQLAPSVKDEAKAMEITKTVSEEVISLMMKACARGEAGMVIGLTESNWVGPHHPETREGRSFLLVACACEHLAVVVLLLNHPKFNPDEERFEGKGLLRRMLDIKTIFDPQILLAVALKVSIEDLDDCSLFWLATTNWDVFINVLKGRSVLKTELSVALMMIISQGLSRHLYQILTIIGSQIVLPVHLAETIRTKNLECFKIILFFAGDKLEETLYTLFAADNLRELPKFAEAYSFWVRSPHLLKQELWAKVNTLHPLSRQ